MEKKHGRSGIGLCEGVAGLLMSNGIYMDVPVQYLRVLRIRKGRKR